MAMPLNNHDPRNPESNVSARDIQINGKPKREVIKNALLSSIWKSKDAVHYICTNDRNAQKFRNIAVESIDEANTRIETLQADGLDVYFACAEYKCENNRTAANAKGAWGFWMDIDCGNAKAESGQGYKNTRKARKKLKKFCRKAGLPLPNIDVNSGGGLHVYWVLDQFVPKEQWKEFADKLKALAKRFGFLADPSRTADIASVMRVPGTQNFKYDTPKRVELVHRGEGLLAADKFLQQIDKGTNTSSQVSATVPVVNEPEPQADITVIDADYPAPAMGNDGRQEFELNLRRLRSALAALDPDCSEYEWKFHRIAALANTAKAYPEHAEDLFQLACDWSSGKLAGRPAVKWTKPAGEAGKDIIVAVWKRFSSEHRGGKKTTLGTIYHAARQASWEYDDAQFKD